jgi:uncharacterized protein YdhG (YjbR/CyaY superfamily)
VTGDDDPAAVDEYIAGFPPDTQAALRQARAAIRDAAPDASEGLSYGIPTFFLKGRYLIYLAGWKRHISIYPIPSGDAALEAELAPYRAGKGTLQFPLGATIPDALIGRIVMALRASRLPSSGPHRKGAHERDIADRP